MIVKIVGITLVMCSIVGKKMLEISTYLEGWYEWKDELKHVEQPQLNSVSDQERHTKTCSFLYVVNIFFNNGIRAIIGCFCIYNSETKKKKNCVCGGPT
jgi:hypothetical protein